MPWCSNCGDEDPIEIKVDFGIGDYEYWGFASKDTNFQLVSHCCEAPIIDKMLTEQAQKDRDEFYKIHNSSICSCTDEVICEVCSHPGNPLNQEYDEGCWQ